MVEIKFLFMVNPAYTFYISRIKRHIVHNIVVMHVITVATVGEEIISVNRHYRFNDGLIAVLAFFSAIESAASDIELVEPAYIYKLLYRIEVEMQMLSDLFQRPYRERCQSL